MCDDTLLMSVMGFFRSLLMPIIGRERASKREREREESPHLIRPEVLNYLPVP